MKGVYKMYKEYRTCYTSELKTKLRNYAESANLDSVIIGVEINASGNARLVVEGETAEVNLVIEYAKKAKRKKVVAVKRESEIFYTGGGIWCGVIPLANGTWASGELNDYLTIYTTRKAALEMGGQYGNTFVRNTTEEDFPTIIELWKKAIEYEKTDCHGLACLCDDWMSENRRIRSAGKFEY